MLSVRVEEAFPVALGTTVRIVGGGCRCCGSCTSARRCDKRRPSGLVVAVLPLVGFSPHNAWFLLLCRTDQKSQSKNDEDAGLQKGGGTGLTPRLLLLGDSSVWLMSSIKVGATAVWKLMVFVGTFESNIERNNAGF